MRRDTKIVAGIGSVVTILLLVGAFTATNGLSLAENLFYFFILAPIEWACLIALLIVKRIL